MNRTMTGAGAALPLVATLVVLVGCGSKEPQNAEASNEDQQTATAGAPAPPQVQIQGAPRVEVELGGVYVVNHDDYDGDLFRVGGVWYNYHDGYWYRSGAYDGPYVAIDVETVPREIFEVPADHWRHHPSVTPPGLAKKEGAR